MVQLSHPYMTNGKTIALILRTFASKVMSLLFNMLSFLPRSKHFLISWLQSPSAVILEPKKIKSVTVSIVCPSICREMMGPDAMILVFWMLSFKLFLSPLSLSSRGSSVPVGFSHATFFVHMLFLNNPIQLPFFGILFLSFFKHSFDIWKRIL